MKPLSMRGIPIYIVVIILMAFFISTSRAGVLSSTTYEECVLEGMKDAQTESAVGLLREVCRTKSASDNTAYKGDTNPHLTDSECYVVYNKGNVVLGRPDPADYFLMELRYGGYMGIHLAIPKVIADRLELEEEWTSMDDLETMPSDTKRFVNKIMRSTRTACSLY